NAGTWFVVLWKRIFTGSTQTFTPLAYHKILQTNPVCRAGTAAGCTKIKYWSTIMVYVKEISGANNITGYLSQPPTYQRSTTDVPTPILWANAATAGTIFMPIDWVVVSGVIDTQTSAEIFQDSSLTTSNYVGYTIGNTAQIKAREIGLHIFNMSSSAQNIYYDNFFIDLTPSTSGASAGYYTY
nr:hypothetical protein [Rhodoferax sp.]